ncbi:2OG-Fe(II) oxygenase [Galbibacter pacificus]|uniref:2OG-Fe(II) oxygenase n=1 Tax=Galbibacter pacificus TaxID=2996052 RepID=A0ABT6FSM0_9FLAO|nr:2OG-Fe(II) oxygenase [Galbibacter pacificus]MDG3582779.1 2OG-Fe(II) oxygenase [Galbibacter pacificus]MDG3586102.1 2OG-Fe(II) oxygenase [Galbibacter pacificus]
MSELFDQLEFVEDPLYERIINDLLEQQYSVIDNFFTDDEVVLLRNSLMAKYEEEQFKKAAIGNKFDEQIIKSIRGDFVLWIDEQKANAAETRFFHKINHMTHYLNKTCFLGILHKEFHYAVYPEGTFYKRHLDTFQNDDRRKLSFVCYLNDEYWKNENGGELVIYQEKNGVEAAKSLYPLPGRVVIFESQLLEHEVKTVLAAERYSITGWLKTR